MASGKITNKNTLTGSLSKGGGTSDHARLLNRDEVDQHPIKAITGLGKELDSKLNAATALPLIEEAVQHKAKGLYFDAMKELARKSYWYLTSEIDPKTGQGTKESVISGPYDLGMGGGTGGGGSSLTTIAIKPVNWPTTVVVGNPLSLTVEWSSVMSEEKEPTGNGSIYLYINDKQTTVKSGQAQGIVTFENINLPVGTHTIRVEVMDAYGSRMPYVGSITAVELLITDEGLFNDGTAWNGSVNYKYKAFGNFSKTIYFIVDGDTDNPYKVLGNVTTSGDLAEELIEGLSHGAHTLEVYFTAELNGELVSSNHLYHELIIYEKENATPIITSSFAKKSTQEQYVSFNIPYYVYVDTLIQPRVRYYLQEQDKEIVELPTFAGGILADRDVLQKLPYRFDSYYTNEALNNYKLIIKCGETEKVFEIQVTKSSINVTPVTTALALHLDAQGRSNTESLEKRTTWVDKASNVSCELSNFNWASNGWLTDLTTNEAFLRVNAGARVTVPYKVLSGTPQRGGKTIELDITARDIRDYETPILTCRNSTTRKFYDVSTTFVDSDIRAKTFEVTLDQDAFKAIYSAAGTYIFEYTAEDTWKLVDGEAVDLNACGITLKEYLQDEEGEYPDEWRLVGDLIVVSVVEDAIGFYVTPQKVALRSLQSKLSVQFKEDEHVRISMVIEDATVTSPTHILWIYVNGIASCAIQYPLQGENFAHENYMYLGADNATLDVYNIRVYNQALTSKQIVENWIADTQDPVLKAYRYTKNNIYDPNSKKITPATIEALGDLPYIIWDIDTLPTYKGDKRLGNVVYKDPLGKERSFKSGDATYNVQGTSSAGYPVKNIRIKYKQAKAEDFPNCDFWWENGYENEDGEDISKFPITVGGIGDNYFTYKVDYASSEGANNVELTKLYNDVSKDLGILTPPQRKNSQVRVGIDGFPIVAFHEDAAGNRTFCTKANFNNDKDNEKVYGFETGDESWEITNNSFRATKFKVGVDITDKTSSDYYSKSFEARFPEDNSDLTKLKAMTAWVASTDPEQATDKSLQELLGVESVIFTYKDKVLGEDNSYKDEEKTSEPFTTDSKEYRLTKFKAELKDWFDVDSTLLYYLFTELFLMIDSRAKNAFPTYFKSRQEGDGGNRWFWIPYDMDTALGINNMGELVFDYSLEDHGEFGKYAGGKVYNGQESVMWNNIREGFYGQLAAMYARMRKSLINFSEIDGRFEEHQNKWPEAIFNEDAIIKYVNPLRSKAEGGLGENYLSMLQGSKAQQRKWWLFNRLRYIDSKYNTADAKSDYIQFRSYSGGAGTVKPSIAVIPYTDIYAAVSYSNGTLVTARAPRNLITQVPTPFTIEDDSNEQEVYVYSASQLKDVGDLAPFYAKTVKVAAATKLQKLKVGDGADTYRNENLRQLELGQNTLLKSIDARNCVNLGKNDEQNATPVVDVSQCTNIEELYFTGTQITGIQLPDGGTIKKLYLPGTMQSLVLRNQPLIEELQIDKVLDTKTGKNYLEIENLWLENIPFDKVNAKEMLELMSNKPEENIGASFSQDFNKYQRGVYLKGIKEQFDTIEDLRTFTSVLDQFFGLSIIGQLIVPDLESKAIVSGNIILKQPIAYANLFDICDWDEDEQAWRLKDYRDTLVTAPNTVCSITFDSANGESVLTRTVSQGVVQTAPATPTKASTIDKTFTFSHWENAQGVRFEDGFSIEVATDMHFTAIYTPAVRQYTVSFDTNSSIVTVNPSATLVDYNTVCPIPTISGAPTGVELKGWYLSNGTKWNFESDTVQTDISLTAKWVDTLTPSIELRRIAYNAIEYTIEDTLGILGWTVLKDPVDPSAPPTEWNYLSSTTNTTKVVGVYDGVNGAGTYYFWALDAGENNEGIKHTVRSEQGLTAYTINVQALTSGIDGYTLVEDATNKVLTSNFALESTVLTLNVQLDSHYESLKINGETSTSSTSFVVNQDKSFELSCDPKKYTVKFDLDGKGTPVEDQIIEYNQCVTRPLAQYWQPENTIISEWYLDKTYTKLWNFDTSTVDSDITLYAKWETLSMPTTITIVIPEDADKAADGTYKVTINYFNGVGVAESEYVRVNFGEETDVFETSAAGTLVHSYSTAGQKTITVYGNNKSYTLGRAPADGYDSPDAYLSIIEPAAYLIDVEFAWDISEIPAGAFKGTSLTALTSKILTEYITSIGRYSFYECNALRELNIPRSLKRIGAHAFQKCSNLVNINFTNSALSVIEEAAFAECISLISIDIPETTVKLGAQSFTGCTNLSKVILRNENLLTEAYVFNNCKQLYSAGPIGSKTRDGDLVDIEYAWNTFIPDYAFSMGRNQTSLSEIILPTKLKSIGSYAFQSTQITKITHSGDQSINATTLVLPEDLEIIGAKAFQSCRNIHTIIIPPTVKSIGKGAFYGCATVRTVKLYLTNSIEKADSVQSGWFYGAGNLGKLELLVSPSISNEEEGIFPTHYFGDYWHEFMSMPKDGFAGDDPTQYTTDYHNYGTLTLDD